MRLIKTLSAKIITWDELRKKSTFYNIHFYNDLTIIHSNDLHFRSWLGVCYLILCIYKLYLYFEGS